MEERYAIEQTLLQRDNLVKVARACTRLCTAPASGRQSLDMPSAGALTSEAIRSINHLAKVEGVYDRPPNSRAHGVCASGARCLWPH